MAQKKSKLTLVPTKKAGDTSALITNGSDAFPEDSYVGSYMAAGNTSATGILEPTYKPGTLRFLCQQNNILSQCIDAMEVNVDGTGHKIELIEDAPENEAEKKMLEDFFKEPYPGKSMVTIRREIRRDLEEAGNGYLEVIRNASDEVVMCNNLEGDTTRLIRLDDPVFAEKTITRNGKEQVVKIRTRERRYVQIVNGKKVYFREFGSSRQLDRTTGEWAEEGVKLPLDKRSSEVLHFTLTKEAKTPYGVPRWINQLPSVLGSRKAEEFNLDFFDAGGLPPVLLLVQGGYLGDELKESLIQHLSGSKSNKHRAAIVEAVSSSGSLDAAGSVQVRVERFGAERQQDAMFQAYDKNAEEHVRVAFRLPPMFIGRAQDYNFATAMTGYMTAEAQVFAPERFEFDERVNNTICKALGAKSYRYKSLPIALTDVASQLQAVQIGLSKHTTPILNGESAVKALNEVAGLSLEYEKPPAAPEAPQAKIDPHTGLPYEKPVPPQIEKPSQVNIDPHTNLPYTHPVPPQLDAGVPDPEKKKFPPAPIPSDVKKTDGLTNLIHLANGWAAVLGINGEPIDGLNYAEIKKAVGRLTGEDLIQFNEIMAAKSLSNSSVDLEGLAELCGCSGTLMSED